MTRPRTAFTGALCALILATSLCAQTYPAKPVRVIVPFAAGGATDIQARVIMRELNEQLRQPFLVDNRVGASGMIGAEAVVRAAPDGYTLLLTTAALATNATLYKGTIKFDAVKDLAITILHAEISPGNNRSLDFRHHAPPVT